MTVQNSQNDSVKGKSKCAPRANRQNFVYPLWRIHRTSTREITTSLSLFRGWGSVTLSSETGRCMCATTICKASIRGGDLYARKHEFMWNSAVCRKDSS